MKQREIIIRYKQLDFNELTAEQKNLFQVANDTNKNSYSIYSQYSVSCVVMLDNKVIVSGTNQENSAYPSGLCAERVAVFSANSQYPDAKISQLVILAKDKGVITDEPVSPCGACLQVMLEAENRQKSPIEILLFGKSKIYKIDSVKDCLPIRFERK